MERCSVIAKRMFVFSVLFGVLLLDVFGRFFWLLLCSAMYFLCLCSGCVKVLETLHFACSKQVLQRGNLSSYMFTEWI